MSIKGQLIEQHGMEGYALCKESEEKIEDVLVQIKDIFGTLNQVKRNINTSGGHYTEINKSLDQIKLGG